MNKKILLVIAASLFAIVAFGQQTKALELIMKGKYDAALKAIEKGLMKNQDDVENNFYKAYLLFQRDYDGYDPVQSYKCLETCEKYYPKLDDKERENLDFIPLNMDKFRNYMDTVCRYALKDAIRTDTYESYQNYIFFFRKASEAYRSEAKMYRDIKVYQKTLKEDTEDAYATFVKTYPEAQQVADAIKRRNEKGYENALAKNTVEAFEAFIKKYPDAVQAAEAQDKLYIIALDDAIAKNSSRALKQYLKKYPNSTQYERAESLYDDQLYAEATKYGDCGALVRFVQKYPNSKNASKAIENALKCVGTNAEVTKYFFKNYKGEKKNQILQHYYDLVAQDGEWLSLKTLYESLDNNQRNLVRDKYVVDSAIAVKGDKLKLAFPYNAKKAEAYDEYIKLAAPREKAFVALQKIISGDIASGNFAGALNTVKNYRKYWSSNTEKIDNLISLLGQNLARVESTPLVVNSANNEYNPVMSKDGKSLFFCADGRGDSKKGVEIYVAEKVGGDWKNPQVIAGVSSKSDDIPQSINSAGNVLYIQRNGRLYFSKKAGATWGKPQRMSTVINSSNWQGDAFISADGKALFFAAKRTDMLNFFNDADYDPFDYHGKIDEAQTDIYVCTIDDNGDWGEPISLGSNINTIYSERTPYLHSDNMHLYFATDGRGGLGGLDMFVSTRLSEDCWDCWSEPVNLGTQINTEGDDMGYKIASDGKTAYYAKLVSEKGKKANFDIFYLTLPEYLQPKNLK
ncbi:MAG: PD40 domain-containing protein [Bacteroidales bacterium]|nr:PD40 domain-containing protein [Bacteroidales bacterium]